jgi:hypothetical protein
MFIHIIYRFFFSCGEEAVGKNGKWGSFDTNQVYCLLGLINSELSVVL